MGTKKNGFTVLEGLLILIIIGALAGVGFYVFNRQKENKKDDANTSNSQKAHANINWEFNGTKWVAQGGTPPPCPQPLFSKSPVDTKLVSSLLYPGQFRGDDYKPHGGFRFDNSKNEDIQVVMPMDAKLVNASRYIEMGEVQYLFTFINPCGIMFRFDHLHTLSPKFQELGNKLPQPQQDDSKTTRVELSINFKAGEVIATAVGFSSNKNVGVDFGVYDLRKVNEISKNQKWADLHINEKEQAWYGVCWFEMLPAENAEKIRNLQAGDFSEKAKSDYCKTAAGATIQ